MQGKEFVAFKNVNFSLDTVLFKNQELEHFEGFGTKMTMDSVATKTVKHIEAIGPNLFQEKYLIIDYRNKRFGIVTNTNKVNEK